MTVDDSDSGFLCLLFSESSVLYILVYKEL